MKEGGPLTRQWALARSGDVSRGRLNEDMAVPKMDGGEEKILQCIYRRWCCFCFLFFVLFPSSCLCFCVGDMRICVVLVGDS